MPKQDDSDAGFADLLEPYRRELQVHCYRMTGSYDEAEDLVQEAFLKAWRSRKGYEGRAGLRTWLYRITTNTCLDYLRRHQRTPRGYDRLPGMEHGHGEPPARIAWLQPYPDELLADFPSEEAGPESQALARETIGLVFLAALQHLPAQQRAVLILRDVVGLSAAETARLLELSTASVNSALQRARPVLRERLPAGRRTEWAPATAPTQKEREVVDRYQAATERFDLAAMAGLLAADAKLTMPPNPYWFVGREAIMSFVAQSLDPKSEQFFGRWRYLHTRANGQPAVASYVQRPGTAIYRAQSIDVLRIEDGRIAEITTFEPHLLLAFGLPLKISSEER